MSMSLKTLIKNNFANFVCYRDGDLWYRIEVTGPPEFQEREVTERIVFDFPIPVADTGTVQLASQSSDSYALGTQTLRKNRERRVVLTSESSHYMQWLLSNLIDSLNFEYQSL